MAWLHRILIFCLLAVATAAQAQLLNSGAELNGTIVYRGVYAGSDPTGRRRDPNPYRREDARHSTGNVQIVVRYAGPRIDIAMEGDNGLSPIRIAGTRTGNRCTVSTRPTGPDDRAMICDAGEFSGMVNNLEDSYSSGQLMLSATAVQAVDAAGRPVPINQNDIPPPLPLFELICEKGLPCPSPVPGKDGFLAGEVTSYALFARHLECKDLEDRLTRAPTIEDIGPIYRCHRDLRNERSERYWSNISTALVQREWERDPRFPWLARYTADTVINGRTFFAVGGYDLASLLAMAGLPANVAAIRMPFMQRSGRPGAADGWNVVIIPFCDRRVPICREPQRFTHAIVHVVTGNEFYLAQQLSAEVIRFCRLSGARRSCNDTLPGDFSAGYWSYDNINDPFTRGNFIGSALKWASFTPQEIASYRASKVSFGEWLANSLAQDRRDCIRNRDAGQMVVC